MAKSMSGISVPGFLAPAWGSDTAGSKYVRSIVSRQTLASCPFRSDRVRNQRERSCPSRSIGEGERIRLAWQVNIRDPDDCIVERLGSGGAARTEYKAVEKLAPGRTILALELAEALEEPGGRGRGAGLFQGRPGNAQWRDLGWWEERGRGIRPATGAPSLEFGEVANRSSRSGPGGRRAEGRSLAGSGGRSCASALWNSPCCRSASA